VTCFSSYSFTQPTDPLTLFPARRAVNPRVLKWLFTPWSMRWGVASLLCVALEDIYIYPVNPAD